MDKKIISEVKFYQGVSFDNAMITHVACDAKHSDKTLFRGITAEIIPGLGIGLYKAATGAKAKQHAIVPFNNVAYFKYLETDEETAPKAAKAK